MSIVKYVLIFACTQEISELKRKIKVFEDNFQNYSEQKYEDALHQYMNNRTKLLFKQSALDRLITACTPMFYIDPNIKAGKCSKKIKEISDDKYFCL